ncbi:hypothetical protein, unlikely [Trypanosoma brucei brucei TREU927]|uniref:Uncharacterized protein n=1 Tax=Trypanosoma brucei brucei (strain 927/4 GUTat10.1) TaxID=185431 RepID=Q38DV7_TRYB2|nr:hypothetical protein, unlikely [Trypanosoma brucei brucei TREU927]EAN77013.1 hypothetical protein, unlikely [Trypanosoma brucei brucei TREU927]
MGRGGIKRSNSSHSNFLLLSVFIQMHGHIYIYIYATRQNKHNVSYRIPSYRLHFSFFSPASAAATVFVVCLFYLFYFASTLVAFDSTRLPLPSAKCTKRKKGKETFYNNPSHEANSHVSFPPSLTTSPFVYISIYLLPRLFPPYVLRVSLHRIHIYIYIYIFPIVSLIPHSFFLFLILFFL